MAAASAALPTSGDSKEEKRTSATTKTLSPEAHFEKTREAAVSGDPIQQYHLAELYHSEQGTVDHYVKKWRWIRLSAEAGYAPAEYALGVSAQQELIQDALGYFLNNPKKNEEEAIPDFYFSPFGNHTEHDVDGLKYLVRAKEKGHLGARFCMALLNADFYSTLNNRSIFPIILTPGRCWKKELPEFKELANKRYKPACLIVGAIYKRGLLDVKRNSRYAEKLFKIAAEDEPAIALCLAENIASTFNEKWRWLQQAAELGAREAMIEIDKILEKPNNARFLYQQMRWQYHLASEFGHYYRLVRDRIYSHGWQSQARLAWRAPEDSTAFCYHYFATPPNRRQAQTSDFQALMKSQPDFIWNLFLLESPQTIYKILDQQLDQEDAAFLVRYLQDFQNKFGEYLSQLPAVLIHVIWSYYRPLHSVPAQVKEMFTFHEALHALLGPLSQAIVDNDEKFSETESRRAMNLLEKMLNPTDVAVKNNLWPDAQYKQAFIQLFREIFPIVTSATAPSDEVTLASVAAEVIGKLPPEIQTLIRDLRSPVAAEGVAKLGRRIR